MIALSPLSQFFCKPLPRYTEHGALHYTVLGMLFRSGSANSIAEVSLSTTFLE